MALNVVVVEQHHECLQWVHWFVRRKVLAPRFYFVHFDAHPDMVVPQCDASLCTRPRALYDYLHESAFGIAEWVWPLAASNDSTKLMNSVEL